MDRREALKKLGAGGVAVVGTSLVISSPAFAFDAPTVTGTPATFTLSTSNASTATLEATEFPTGTCPESSTNTNDQSPPGSPSYSWTYLATSGVGALVTRTTGNWAAGDTVTGTVTVPYSCTYSTGQTTTLSYSWTRTFTAAGQAGSANWTGGPISGPTPA